VILSLPSNYDYRCETLVPGKSCGVFLFVLIREFNSFTMRVIIVVRVYYGNFVNVLCLFCRSFVSFSFLLGSAGV
jgi:hypothetical protein